MTTPTKGNEFFSLDENGKKIDAHLHEPILNNPEAQDNDAHDMLKRLIAKGYPQDMIDRVSRGFAEEQLGRKPKEKMDRRIKKFAGGGAPKRAEYAPWDINQGANWRIKPQPSAHIPHMGGMIKSSIPGRTDKIPLSVKSGSYILPADIPSALGQGNTEAGAQILGKMFKISSGGRSNGARQPGFNWMKQPKYMKAEGGGTGEQTENHVPIIAAGGECVIPPDVVQELGHGDIDAGHRVLDRFVLNVRKRNIDTLKSLKPPKNG